MTSERESGTEAKYEQLKRALRLYKRVGIAFSGGVDSSVLLMAAGEALGKKNVIALHGRSELNRYETEIEEFFVDNFDSLADLRIVDLTPLDWPDFVSSRQGRCYYCKRKTYLSFFEVLKSENIGILLDGTNLDDLDDDRPGLQALEELGVATPLVDAAINKREVRFLAHSLGLPNYNTPSNSCLATRLQYLPSVERGSLEKVRKIESELQKIGFTGCRVKPDGNGVIIQLRQQDFVRFSFKYNRVNVVRLCREFGYDRVLVDMEGRN